jgi:RNA polymerase sigma factor (sigma-70 family)
MQKKELPPELSKSWQAYLSDRSIHNRNQLVLENTGLVRHVVAKRFEWAGEGTDFQLHADLIQEGMFGLIKAIEGFDPSRGNAFSTYAVVTIWGTIMHFLRKFRTISSTGAGGAPFLVSFSLDKQVPNLEEPGSYLDQLIDTDSQEAGEKDLLVSLYSEVALLRDRHRQVLELYLQGKSDKASAQAMGVSASAVSCMRARATKSLARRLFANAS